jgi:HEPN domain-containing protein
VGRIGRCSRTYHCQQACEKALKALLAWHDVPFRKTHSLEEVGEPKEREPASVDLAIDTAVALVAAILDRLPAALRS